LVKAVADHASAIGSYRPPESAFPVPFVRPPQTIIFEPDHTAVAPVRAAGTPVVDVAVHALATGS